MEVMVVSRHGPGPGDRLAANGKFRMNLRLAPTARHLQISTSTDLQEIGLRYSLGVWPQCTPAAS